MKLLYPVLPGCTFGAFDQWKEGDLVLLTEAEARPHIGIVLGEVVAETQDFASVPATGVEQSGQDGTDQDNTGTTGQASQDGTTTTEQSGQDGGEGEAQPKGRKGKKADETSTSTSDA